MIEHIPELALIIAFSGIMYAVYEAVTHEKQSELPNG